MELQYQNKETELLAERAGQYAKKYRRSKKTELDKVLEVCGNSAAKFFNYGYKQTKQVLKSSWKKPLIPSPYQNICVYEAPNKLLIIDFYKVNGSSIEYASDNNVVEIDWPWIDGYSPNEVDWEMIGVDYFW